MNKRQRKKKAKKEAVQHVDALIEYLDSGEFADDMSRIIDFVIDAFINKFLAADNLNELSGEQDEKANQDTASDDPKTRAI